MLTLNYETVLENMTFTTILIINMKKTFRTMYVKSVENIQEEKRIKEHLQDKLDFLVHR